MAADGRPIFNIGYEEKSDAKSAKLKQALPRQIKAEIDAKN